MSEQRFSNKNWLIIISWNLKTCDNKSYSIDKILCKEKFSCKSRMKTLVKKIISKRIIKSLQENWLWTYSLFIDIIVKNKRGLELVTSPFSGCQIFVFLFSYVICHLANFDVFIQRGFLVIQKSTIYNLCKPFHVSIIIIFSTFF